MIASTISTACSLCVSRWRMAPWASRPFLVINPLPTLWLGLGGDSCFGCFSPMGVPIPFFDERSSLPLFLHFDVPLATAFEADAEDLSFCCYCLRAAANCLTNAFCLPKSISAKDKLKIDEHDVKRDLIKWRVKKLTMTRRSVQSSSYRHQLRTTTEGVDGVKCYQVLPLPFFKGNGSDPPKEIFLLVGYIEKDEG